MEILIGVSALLALAVLGLIYLLSRRSSVDAQAKEQVNSISQEIAELKGRSDLLVKQVGESIRTLQESLNQNLSTSKVEMKQSLDSTQKVISAVNEQLGALGKNTERIHEFGKDIRSLQDVLQAPKLRGMFGEFLLEDLLRSMLPPAHFEMPSGFRDGTMADAAVLIAGKRVPIDAKFPLESFRRMVSAGDDAARETARKEFAQSVRVRVNEIADRYIRPEEGTYEFALMYLPSEAIYYEIVVKEQDFDNQRNPLQYALSRKVIPVSPSSFYAYLSTIAFGLRGMQIEKEAEEIRGRVAKLQIDFIRFLDMLRSVDKHLDLAKKKFEDTIEKGGRLNERMTKISGVISGEGPEKPVLGENPVTQNL